MIEQTQNYFKNPLINIPQPKRIKKQKQQFFKKEEKIEQLKKSKIINKNGIRHKDKNKIEDQKRNKNLKYKRIKKDNIGEILSYFLAQSQYDKGQKLQQLMQTVYQWQNTEIQKFVDDPNLGDFIIKLPNPDNLSQQYFKIYPDAKNQQKNVPIQFQKALQIFNDIFNVEGASKNRIQNQKKAFTIAFYFLNFQQIFKWTQNQLIKQLQKNKFISIQQINIFQKQADIFVSIFKYFLQIEDVDFYTYQKNPQKFKIKIDNYFDLSNQIKQDNTKLSPRNKKQQQHRSSKIEKSIRSIQNIKQNITIQILILFNQLTNNLKSVQTFNQHKIQILQFILSTYVKSLIKTFMISKGLKPLPKINQLRNKYILFLIIKKLSKISLFFTYFLQNGAQNLIKFIEKQLNRKQNVQSYRKIFRGQCLQKIIDRGNLIWVNNKSKPADLFTLIRNCINYQLTQNCLLRVRCFLTKNQKYLMLVVKSSQQVLQYYAQKNSTQMQVQLGATDIFSFQPVDKYLRPLRLNYYIRDEGFKKKYGLDSNKLDKDQYNQSKSIQSQALNIYKRAEKMNNDQLRVKIILDQQDSDQSLKWMSNKLNIKLIQDTNILTNDYNSQTVDRQTWQCYYVYNKLIIHFVHRLRKLFSSSKNKSQNQKLIEQLNNNIGLILRLMFIKALTICNQNFYKHRENKTLIPNQLYNIFVSKRKLQNIWDRMNVQQPTGFYTYMKNKSMQRLWRKFQVNQLKERSKFFPAQRIYITNKIIQEYINIGQSKQKMHIVDYYPLHDPFVLKNIKIEPYLINLKQKNFNKKIDNEQIPSNIIKNIYTQYQSQRTTSDFTKYSVDKKLSVQNSLFQKFSIQTVRYYCGQKIAFYFDFMKHLTTHAFPYIIPAFIIQIILWVEQQHLLQKGSSRLKYFNDFLVFLITLFNIFWTTNLVQHWKHQEKILAQKYGVEQIPQKQQKRVRFVGQFKRNFQTDNLNFQYVPKWKTILKSIFTFLINVLYFSVVCLVIIEIFILKSILFQKGYSQIFVNTIPSILISLTVQIFNYLYIYLLKLITQFQNHKTIADFQQSLISKSYCVTFVITFISIFIYGFFSEYLDAGYLCMIKTTQTTQDIHRCDYFVSQQLFSLVLIDLIFTVISAIIPYAKFLIKDYMERKNKKLKTKLFFNKFQAIDQFYEEQDNMQTYMFNDQIDNSWQGYMNLINVFTALSLFGPALPFMYVMLFFSGVVRLHASKYEVIYLTKRSIPIKVNSINWWLIIIQVISVVSIFTNVAYMIFTRQVFTQNQSQLFFFFIIMFFLLKYYLVLQYQKKENDMGQRNKLKISATLMKKSDEKNNFHSEYINTDILNVYYKEEEMRRNLPVVKKAKVIFR